MRRFARECRTLGALTLGATCFGGAAAEGSIAVALAVSRMPALHTLDLRAAAWLSERALHAASTPASTFVLPFLPKGSLERALVAGAGAVLSLFRERERE